MKYHNELYRFLRLSLSSLALYGVSVSMAAAAPVSGKEYRVELLPSLVSGAGTSVDVNELGVATGKSRGIIDGLSVDVVVLWGADGKVVQIDFIGQENYTAGRAINNVGHIVGQLNTLGPSLWANTQRTQLLGLDNTFIPGFANDIDDDNLIVGCIRKKVGETNDYLPTFWHNSQTAQLIPGAATDTPGCANAINNFSHITGSATINGITHAVIWRDNFMVELAIPQGFSSCEGKEINDAGWVVGSCQNSQGDPQPVLWLDGAVIVLNNKTGVAYDVNNAGEVLAYAGVPFAGGAPFIWRDGVVQDLSKFVEGSSVLVAINDNGVIVGDSYRLTPITNSAETDLSITMQDSSDPILKSELLSYSINVTNKGPADATGVTVIDTLPKDITFEAVIASQGNCIPISSTVKGRGNKTTIVTTGVNCALGNLANGNIASIEIVIRPNSTGANTNNANVSATEGDFDLTNNVAAETTIVEDSTDGKLCRGKNCN